MLWLFQFLIKKHVIAVQARKKLNHALGKISAANIVLDAIETGGELDDDEPGEGEESLDCGACLAIKDVIENENDDDIFIGDIE